jgi:hypothetical protein
MEKELEGFAATPGVRVANYMNDARFEDDDFYDFDHLNARGSARFTEIVRAELVSQVAGVAK